jgi:invasion protein IalB
MIVSRIRTISILFALTQFAGGMAFAQDKKPAPAVGSQPETTTATFGAWTLRCERRADVDKGQKLCEVEESVVPKDQQNPIAHIGIVHPLNAERGALRINVIFPPNIFIPTAPGIRAKDGDPGVALVWQRCFSGGCFAEAAIPPAEVKAWRAVEADTGRITFTEAVGRNLAVQFSLRGFAQALDALEKVKS